MNRSGVNVISSIGASQSARIIKYSNRTMNDTMAKNPFTYQFWKDILDRLLAVILLIVLSPLLIIVTIGILLDSAGSPIFSQERVGKNGRKFNIYKFRSMYKSNDDSKYKAFLVKYVQENAISPLDSNGEDIYERLKDPRVTRLGRILRKTNIDELPQIINILKGEMSFIGPRPDITFTVNMYNAHQLKRLSIKPGITGLWQVCGRKSVSFTDMIRRDLYYVKKVSLILDAKILVLTLITILKCDGS